MLTLSLLLLGGVLAAVVLFSVACALLAIPFALIFALLPLFVAVAGVIALVKGILRAPFTWGNLLPGGLLLLAAWLLFHI